MKRLTDRVAGTIGLYVAVKVIGGLLQVVLFVISPALSRPYIRTHFPQYVLFLLSSDGRFNCLSSL